MNGLIGGHVIANIGSYNRDNNHAALTALGGKFAVFVNDIHAVSMWVGAGGIAAHRVLTGHFNDDDADKNIPNPEEYADHICDHLDVATAHLPAHLKRNAVAHGGNELFTGLAGRTDAWLARFIIRVAARGYLTVVANWAYKNIPPDLPLTRAALLKYGGWMGFHEGTYGAKPLAPDAYADGAIGGFISWQLANPGIPVWITEFAGSATPHYGWQTLYNGDADLWADQIEWAMRHVYRPRNVPICMYTNQWDKGEGWSWNVPALIANVHRLNQEFVYMTQPVNQYEPAPDPETLGDPVEMVVTATAALTANVRAGTNTSAGIITSVKVNDRVLARPQQTDKLNGFRWWNIRNKNGAPLRDAAGMPYTDGWIADVATLSAPVVQEPPVVLLNVPHVSQLGTSANLRNNDCFNATAQGIALWRLGAFGLTMPLLQNVNGLIPLSPLATDDNPVNTVEAESFMRLLGIAFSYSDQLKAPAILAELDAGNPVILLGNYGHLNPADRKMGHWFTVVGYTHSSFIIHDPYLLGPAVRISKAAMERAQTDLVAWNGQSFAGKPYQGYRISL